MNELQQIIDENIYQNDTGAITGTKLNHVLTSMANEIESMSGTIGPDSEGYVQYINYESAQQLVADDMKNDLERMCLSLLDMAIVYCYLIKNINDNGEYDILSVAYFFEIGGTGEIKAFSIMPNVIMYSNDAVELGNGGFATFKDSIDYILSSYGGNYEQWLQFLEDYDLLMTKEEFYDIPVVPSAPSADV